MEFNVLRNSIEDFDSEEATAHPYQWNNFSAEAIANHDEAKAKNNMRRQHHIDDIQPRNFVELCLDWRMQGVGGYDSWGSRPEKWFQPRISLVVHDYTDNVFIESRVKTFIIREHAGPFAGMLLFFLKTNSINFFK